MKQTFEELIRKTNKVFYQESSDSTGTSIDINDVLELLNLVRKTTLQECVKKAKIKEDWWQDNGSPEGFSYTTIDKNSILNLDLNSIEIDE